MKEVIERVDYRVVLLDPGSRMVFAVPLASPYILPSVHVESGKRPARELQKAIRSLWGLSVLILNFAWLGPSHIATAEVLCVRADCSLKLAGLDEVNLKEESRVLIKELISGAAGQPLCRLGWIDEATTWIETAVQRHLAPKEKIEQFNGGGGFMLLRLWAEDGAEYWLKATGHPNRHEFSITECLSRIDGAQPYLPAAIAFRPEWNAWLMSGELRPLTQIPSGDQLSLIVQSLARLQIATVDHTEQLIERGASEKSCQVFLRRSEEMFTYIAEAMSATSATQTPGIERNRLQQVRIAFEESCQRIMELDIPDSILHGDLNLGNILVGEDQCQFIDWSEASVGNPLISLRHLFLLSKTEEPQSDVLLRLYLAEWRDICQTDELARAFLYIPILAAASALLGRGDWLQSPDRNDPQRQSRARMLARHMARAARQLEV